MSITRSNLEIQTTTNNDDEEEDDTAVRLIPIIPAFAKENLEMIKLLFEYNPNVYDADANGGFLPLVIAARKGRLEVVKMILAHLGVTVNESGFRGQFALSAASSMGNYDVAELLVNHGEHTQDEFSEALGRASRKGHTGVMRILMEQGADANHPGAYLFRPPLYMALSNGCLEAARLLIRNGATSESSFKLLIRRRGSLLHHTLRWLSQNTNRPWLEGIATA